MAKKLEDRRDPIFVVVLKVSYYIKKRGWHENQSDGMRHKQKESTVYNRAISERIVRNTLRKPQTHVELLGGTIV